MAEVRKGRGAQFSPAVVAAFFAIAGLRPGELGLDERALRAG
jgi:hypothetical protein